MNPEKDNLRLLVVFASLVALIAPHCTVAETASEAFCRKENAAWSASTVIPPDRPWTGEFVESYDRVRQRMESLIDEARTRPTSRAELNLSHLYDSVIAAGASGSESKALLRELEAIDQVQSAEDVARWIARAGRSHRDLTEGSVYPAPVPFLISVWTDDSNTKRNAAVLNQSGLGLPGRAYYLDDSQSLKNVRERYVQVIGATLAVDGADAARAASEVLSLETQIAELHWDDVQLQDRGARRKLTLRELQNFAPAFSWKAYFAESGLSADDALVLRAPSYVRDVTTLFADARPSTIKNYFRWQLLRHYAFYSLTRSSEMVTRFYQTEVQGSKQLASTRQVAISTIEAYLAPDLADEYVKRYFPESSRQRVLKIGEAVRAAFIQRLRTTKLLSNEARAEAVSKIERLNIEIGYPGPSAKTPITVRKGELLENLVALSVGEYQEQIDRLKRAADPRRWWMSPIAVNASYSQSSNTLIIPAGRIQPPLFDATASDAANFGGIGSLIGHEMGHAIDNQGRQYDRNGVIREWWTDQDKQGFTRVTEKLITQYAKYEPLPGLTINGTATLSENIADLVGLSIAYDALGIFSGGAVATDQRRLFLQSYARRWRAKYSEQLLIRVVKSDTHAPNQFRCSGPLENFRPFYDAMGIELRSPPVTLW